MRVASARRGESRLGLDPGRRSRIRDDRPRPNRDPARRRRDPGGAPGGRRPSTPIDEDTRFFADLGLASIDAVVLGEAIQEHYGRPLPFHELMAEIGRRTDRDLSIGELVRSSANHL